MKRPHGYRTAISREVFEFVMRLLRDTLGTTGRYLDLMRGNAPLRIQGPGYRGLVDRSVNDWVPRPPGPSVPRQFYRYFIGSRDWQSVLNTGRTSISMSRLVHRMEYGQHINMVIDLNHGSLVPFRHTYNATRII